MTATALDQQPAELRSAADVYAARHQFIPDLTWQEGVRIAVNFTLDFDSMLLRRLLNEPPMQLAKGRIRRPGRHLAADRAVRRAQGQGDDLHAGAGMRALSASLARRGRGRPRDRRPHVGAP